MEINIPPQQIHANSKGGLINEEGVMSSEYGTFVQDLITIVLLEICSFIVKQCGR